MIDFDEKSSVFSGSSVLYQGSDALEKYYLILPSNMFRNSTERERYISLNVIVLGPEVS